jgi:pimeloyl-ACP methyl ester carboxylesterase
MDNSHYKETTVSRGLTYHYYFSPPTNGKPILLFLHGFPSTSHDWNRQIAHFQPKGYGIVAPDMLGFGRTSRPLDPNAFRANLMAKDIIDILNKESIDKVIGIAHDWYAQMLYAYYRSDQYPLIAQGMPYFDTFIDPLHRSLHRIWVAWGVVYGTLKN